MATTTLQDVLEATGYLAGGEPAHGVLLGDEARRGCRTRQFTPDARWRSDSAVTVHFKYEPDVPADERVAAWRREIWNQGFAPLLWVVSPGTYRSVQRLRPAAGVRGRRRPSAPDVPHRRACPGRARRLRRPAGDGDGPVLAAGRRRRRRSPDQRRSPVAVRSGALERDLVAAGLDRAAAQGLIGRSIFTQYLIDRRIVTAERLESEYGHGALSAVLRDRPATGRLFDWLRDTFNGDMFPPEDASVPDAISAGSPTSSTPWTRCRDRGRCSRTSST